MQQFMGNPMQFTDLKYLKELCSVIRRGVFCVHKPSFLMPGHIYKYKKYIFANVYFYHDFHLVPVHHTLVVSSHNEADVDKLIISSFSSYYFIFLMYKSFGLFFCFFALSKPFLFLLL